MNVASRFESARFAVLAACVILIADGCGWGGSTSHSSMDPDSVPSAFAHPQAALAWPGATRAFQVRPDGSLYNGVWRVVPRCLVANAEADPPRRIAYEDRWCPVTRWHRTAGGVRWEFEAVPFSADAPADTQLLVSLAVRARNVGGSAEACTFECVLAPPPDSAGWVATDGPEGGTALPRWSGEAAVAGYSPSAAPDGAPRAAFILAPGASREMHVVLAAYPTSARIVQRASRVSHSRRVEDCERYWRAATSGGLQLKLNDPELENAVLAARVVLLTCRERRGVHWLPTGGPFQYHDVWLRDGARAVAALAVAGHTRESRELADGFTAYQWPQGPFLSQRGQLDGNGQALWAFAQACLRPAPDSTVARFAERALAATRWNETQRNYGSTAPWPGATLLPYAEPRDGEMVRAQLTGNDAWALAGMESSSRLLHAAGREADAREVDALRAKTAADFFAALARLGTPDLPPSWQRAGRDWGNLAAGWPCRALPAGDPHLSATAQRVWSHSGAPGLVSYGVADSVHGYLGADLGTWALLAGRPADAERVLAALLHWRDATGAGAELFSVSTRDFGLNAPPHPTSAAALVALARNMLVYDDGDSLQLTLGGRAAWWRGARVTGAPTRWGTLSLEFARQGDTARWTWSRVPVWTTLTLPPGTVLASAAAPPLRGVVGGHVALAPPGTTSASVTLAVAAEHR